MNKLNIDKKAIRDLAEIMNETGLGEIEIENGDHRLRVSRGSTSAGVDAAQAFVPAAMAAPVAVTVFWIRTTATARLGLTVKTATVSGMSACLCRACTVEHAQMAWIHMPVFALTTCQATTARLMSTLVRPLPV